MFSNPWYVDRDPKGYAVVMDNALPVATIAYNTDELAPFIAATPQVVKELLGEVKRLRGELDQVRTVLPGEFFDNLTALDQPAQVVDTDGPVHAWFGLTYSSYQVLPRVLMQSMPVAWQRQMVVLLEEMRDAFSHLDQAECYDVQPAIEVEASSLTESQLKSTGVTADWEGDEEDGEFVYRDANGDDLESWSRVLVHVAEPLPPYNRGRTKIPTREQSPARDEAGDTQDDDAPTCRDCDTWPCGRHATDEDKAEYARATGSVESGSGAAK